MNYDFLGTWAKSTGTLLLLWLLCIILILAVSCTTLEDPETLDQVEDIWRDWRYQDPTDLAYPKSWLFVEWLRSRAND